MNYDHNTRTLFAKLRYKTIDFNNEAKVHETMESLGIPFDPESLPDERASILRKAITQRSWLTWIDLPSIADKGIKCKG